MPGKAGKGAAGRGKSKGGDRSVFSSGKATNQFLAWGPIKLVSLQKN